MEEVPSPGLMVMCMWGSGRRIRSMDRIRRRLPLDMLYTSASGKIMTLSSEVLLRQVFISVYDVM